MAASALAAAPPARASTVVPALLAALDDPAADVRAQAAYGVGVRGGDGVPVVARLLERLGGVVRQPAEPSRTAVGVALVEAVAKRGRQAKPAIPTLVSLLGDGDRLLRDRAAEAIVTIGAGPENVPALVA